jgi:nucleoside-diphosphate-sugar epimerase
MKVFKTLVTGGSGFIGSEVYLRLGKVVGFENIVLVGRKKPDLETSLLSKRLRRNGVDPKSSLGISPFYEIDFSRSQETLASLRTVIEKERPEKCIHMAAMIKAPKGATLAEQERANIGLTQDFLQISQDFGFKRFVFTSSVVAFGGSFEPRVRSEKDFPNFLKLCEGLPYFSTKRQAHLFVLEQRQAQRKISVSLVCPGIVHGPLDGEKSSRSHLRMLVTGKLPFVPQGGGNFVGLDRVAEMHIEEVLREGPEDKVRLAVDQNLDFADYFELYLRIYNQIHGTKLRIPSLTLPNIVGRTLGSWGRTTAKLGFPLPNQLDPLVASSLYLYFKSDFPSPATVGIEQSLRESIETLKTEA